MPWAVCELPAAGQLTPGPGMPTLMTRGPLLDGCSPSLAANSRSGSSGGTSPKPSASLTGPEVLGSGCDSGTSALVSHVAPEPGYT